jgi:hypothetical protein
MTSVPAVQYGWPVHRTGAPSLIAAVGRRRPWSFRPPLASASPRHAASSHRASRTSRVFANTKPVDSFVGRLSPKLSVVVAFAGLWLRRSKHLAIVVTGEKNALVGVVAGCPVVGFQERLCDARGFRCEQKSRTAPPEAVAEQRCTMRRSMSSEGSEERLLNWPDRITRGELDFPPPIGHRNIHKVGASTDYFSPRPRSPANEKLFPAAAHRRGDGRHHSDRGRLRAVGQRRAPVPQT